MRCSVLLGLLLTCCAISQAQTASDAIRPAVVTAQMKHGKIEYRLDGRIVENSAPNSLITNLGKVLVDRGKDTPVFIVIDVRAPFRQFRHIDTALDKVDLPNRRYFVSEFSRPWMMREVHWADTAVPIPQNAPDR